MRDIKNGKFDGDGTAVYVELGFMPDNIRVLNIDGGPDEGQHLNGAAVKRIAAGTMTALAANKIEPFAGGELAAASKVIRAKGLPKLATPSNLVDLTDGETIETVPAGKTYTAAAGFLFGTDADLNVAAETVHYSCQRGDD